MQSDTILIIGAGGQIGGELTMYLRNIFGSNNVIATDLKKTSGELSESGPFEELNVLDKNNFIEIVKKYDVTQIYNLAAMLSATGEKFPLKAWQLNMDGLFNTLEIAKDNAIKKVYWPSSIAAFGPTTEKQNTQQNTIMDPVTIYGISKLAGERLCEWYFLKHHIDVRSIRYPGLISYKTEPGGGTTDYAVDIYFKAKAEKKYTCFLEADTKLPMMYMPDAIRGTVELMETNAAKIKIRSSYNFAAMSFDPQMVAESIKKIIPEFEIDYKIDFRQQIAEGWPQSIDDTPAKNDWGWKPEFGLDKMTKDMLEHV
ncbi:MAG: NAD-dependent epimerase/dehydratase family protein [Fimbriimonadaceae bacterium]|nr:NAD-dependent epimerase/dehydratase family protein [Chitinophagales bacterium]